MIECASFENRLDDYLDGLLDDAARRELETHAKGCSSCAATLEAQRDLLRATAELPREIEPSRDLLPGIRRSAIRSGARPRAWWLGLAAALLILLSTRWCCFEMDRLFVSGDELETNRI